MIVSLKCKHTEELHKRQRNTRFPAITDQARKKLLMLHTTVNLEDLRVLPLNHLEIWRL